jgi:ribosomal protein L10
MGGIQAPARGLLAVLQGPARNLASVLKQISEKQS